MEPERPGNRKIAAHDLVEAGFDVAAISNAGGWKSLMMPNYYTRELRAKQSAMAHMIARRKKETSCMNAAQKADAASPNCQSTVKQVRAFAPPAAHSDALWDPARA
jgi:hypothetical protein